MRRFTQPQHAMKRGLPAVAGAASGLVMLLAAGGCSVGPKYTKPDTAVDSAGGWREQGDPHLDTRAQVDGQWWKGFHDPTLDRLVDIAYKQNLPLQVAGLRIVESRAQLAVATGNQWPQIQALFASATAVGLSQDAANVKGFDRNYLDYQLGFDAVWELDFWGKYRRGVEAAKASLLATVGDYYFALVSLTAEVARTYVVARTFEELIAESEENVKVQEEGLKIAQARFKGGATSELDVTQAITLLESTRATIPSLQASLQQARNALSTLLGQPPGSADALLEGPKAIPKAPDTVAVSVPAEMLRRRPDIRSAEFSAAAQCARVGVAQADLYPSFALFGSIGFEATSTGSSSGKLFDGNNLFYSIGPRIRWPFLNYGRIKNAVRVEDARFEQALVGYRDTVLKAAQEVEDALAGFLNAQQGAVLGQRSVDAAQRSVRIAVVQYREGAVDYQRVLDAERSLLQQQTSLTQTTSTVATSVIALYKALGGGWESHKDEPFVPERMQQEMKQRTNWGDMLSEQPRQQAAAYPEPAKPQ
jgi:NodT family efflux transporter outer membrane factor (OMF) lipoprotein